MYVVPAETGTGAASVACCQPWAPSVNVTVERTAPFAPYRVPVWVPVLEAARQYRRAVIEPLTSGVNLRPSVNGEPLFRTGCCGESVVSSSEHGHALAPAVVMVSV